ncbi:MAG: glycogen debranching enzyme N-terminal domain-containing protein, partial [Planctomycetaceae bacterium]|nr:glycogen debranching enzyme N-terminal domain-containing protein [Planctomycetaceae bacterium]
MSDLIRTIENPCPDLTDELPSGEPQPEAEQLREWIITNGLGGYASGTICGQPTRRYHGLLIAALPTPLGRTMMLNQLIERLAMGDGRSIALVPEALAGRPEHRAAGRITEFRLELGLPVWRIEAAGMILEKRVLIPHLQNTVHVAYRLLDDGGYSSVRLILRPMVRFRSHDALADSTHQGPYRFTACGDRYEISANDGIPPLRLFVRGHEPAFTLDAARSAQMFFGLEAQRGYDATGDRWSPGYFHVELKRFELVKLIASTESWETMLAMRFAEVLQAEHVRRSRLIA